MSKTYQVGVRLSIDDISVIDKWIENGDFDNRSEFVRFAVKKVIKAYDGNRIGFDVTKEAFEKEKTSRT